MLEFIKKLWSWVKNFAQKVCNGLAAVYHWMRTDGIMHATITALIAITAGVFLPALWAFLIAMLVGIAWEVYSVLAQKGTPEWHDFWCDLIGATYGLLIILLYHI